MFGSGGPRSGPGMDPIGISRPTGGEPGVPWAQAWYVEPQWQNEDQHGWRGGDVLWGGEGWWGLLGFRVTSL
jgi:hypothetical protein